MNSGLKLWMKNTKQNACRFMNFGLTILKQNANFFSISISHRGGKGNHVKTLEVYTVKTLEVYTVKTLEVYIVKALEVYTVKALEVYTVKALEVYTVKHYRCQNCSLEVIKHIIPNI